MVKRVFIAVLTVILFLVTVLTIIFFSFAVTAADTRVFDDAGLMNADEVGALENYILELRTKTGRDFVFLTDKSLPYNDDYDTAEKAAVAHAEDFYDYGKFGDESNNFSGIIYYLDMSNRIPVIITTGDMIDIIDDARLKSLFNVAYDKLGNEDYYGSAQKVFAQAKRYIDEGVREGQYRYDEKTGEVLTPTRKILTLPEIAVSLGIGVIIALSYFMVVKSRYSLKGSTYRYNLGANAECVLTSSSDTFLREKVTRTPRANNVSGSGGGGGRGSGTHTGSSGTSHGGGGGGRRF